MMVEVEPEDFIKGLRLLHSRSPESSDELKKLLDQYHFRKLNFGQSPLTMAGGRGSKMIDSSSSSSSAAAAFSSIKPVVITAATEESSSSSAGTKKSKFAEDDSEATDVEDNDPTMSGFSDSGLDFQHHHQQQQQNYHSGYHANPVDVCCTICKQNEITGGTNNRILECQECRLFYHQECHKPPIPKKELNDPRTIWYCFKCKASGKKIGGGKFLSVTAGGASSKLMKTGSSTLHSSSNSSSPIDDKMLKSETDLPKSGPMLKRGPKTISSTGYGTATGKSTTGSATTGGTINLGTKRGPGGSGSISIGGSGGGTGSAYDKRTVGLKKSKFGKL